MQDLFDFIAMTLKEFVSREEDDFDQKPDRSRELGFSFSFPVRQLSVSSGVLIKWTKGFAVGDAVSETFCFPDKLRSPFRCQYLIMFFECL